MDAGALSPLPSFDALAAARLGALDPARLGALETARLDADGARADDAEASRGLEKLFATLLVKEMRRALADGFFGTGSSGDIYGGWFDEHIGAALAESGTLDLAGMIKTSLSAKSRADAAAAATTEEGR
jgi:Rod binding domain-containing protein